MRNIAILTTGKLHHGREGKIPSKRPIVQYSHLIILKRIEIEQIM